ncbi:MAG: hypothetical protein KKD44_19315 [Proteobacteria bacterium]|nr:hypothetical protein [Pseudomonadota bacterium]
MKWKKMALTAVVLFWMCQTASAASKQAEFALFKRSISPDYKWGENGVITIPKAIPTGKWNIYAAASAQDSGSIEGDRIFLTSTTIMIGTSDDVEFGYTRRQFIWDNFDKTDLSMDTYSFKARIFHMTDSIIPQVALGVNAVSLANNEFDHQEDILFNPYLTATIQVPLFTDKAVLSATAVAESIYNEGESSDLFFSAGTDLVLFNMVYLMAEVQGIDKDQEDYVVNIGAKVKMGWFSLGLAGYNVIQKDVSTGDPGFSDDSTDLRVYGLVEVPLGKIFTKEDK